MLQVSYMYVFAYFLKTHEWWRSDYTAAYYALRLDYFRMPLGEFFLLFPTALKLLTFGTRTSRSLSLALFACVIFRSSEQ